MANKITSFFQVDKKRRPKLTDKQPGEIIDLTASSDIEQDLIDAKQIKEFNSIEMTNSSASTEHAVQNDSNNNNPHTGNSLQSIAEILDSIPSPELPDVDPNVKPVWRGVKQQPESSETSGIEINAQENCLTGMTFVITGQLPTLGREEIQSIIKRYGGNFTSALSGKTSCLILGEDAGPAKIGKARKLRVKVLDEAGFLQLLKLLPKNGGDSKVAERETEKRKKELEEIKLEAERLKTSPKKRKLDGMHAGKSQRERDSTSSEEVDEVEKNLWTTKYAPNSLKDICGNNAAVQRLSNWLKNWHASRHGNRSEGSDFRAAMLSGPPGIGKTTAAHLIGKLNGYNVVEYNASDTRSKSLLQAQVSQTLNNSTLSMSKLANGANGVRKLLVIMDEVDGMSAGDRGGVGAMAALARTTNVPLILICNERTLPKMRPFDRTVFDIQFRRPDASQVRHRLMSIAHAEGFQLDSNAVEQLTQATRSDIRQMINLLETYSTTASSMNFDESKQFSKLWNKEIVLKPFDIASRLLSRATQSQLSTSSRMELYFHDYDFAPLMIQENYLLTSPSLKSSAEAAKSISDGDLVDKLIHGPQQQWSLMPLHALLSCVKPSFSAAGQARGRFLFTGYLGNNSKGMKYRRLLTELQSHMRLKLATNAADLRMDIQPFLAHRLLKPLLNNGVDAIPDVIEFMDEYFITKEDWDVVMELGIGPNSSEDMAKRLPVTVKSAFTRKYNSMSHPLPFMKSINTKIAATSSYKTEVPDNEDVFNDDVTVDEPEIKEEETSLEADMKNDKYIKSKSKSRAPKASTTSRKSKTKKSKD